MAEGGYGWIKVGCPNSLRNVGRLRASEGSSFHDTRDASHASHASDVSDTSDASDASDVSDVSDVSDGGSVARWLGGSVARCSIVCHRSG